MKLQRQSWKEERIAELETELAEIPEIKEGMRDIKKKDWLKEEEK